MKIANNQPAPNFTVNDVYGNLINLQQFKGRKVHLIFYRFAGCPFCNLRFHQINKLTDEYKANNVALISVYESSIENMRAMMADEKFYSLLIPNADSSLYKLYDLERSKLSLFIYLVFKGGLADVIKGGKLFKNKVAQDGHVDRLEAEFLIDAAGKVVNAHYAKTQGDYLNIDAIRGFITK
jgi:peroxiredoxin Q/BCP